MYVIITGKNVSEQGQWHRNKGKTERQRQIETYSELLKMTPV